MLVGLALAVSCTASPDGSDGRVTASPGFEGGIGAPAAEVVDPDAQLVTNAGIFGEPRTIDPQLASLPAELDVTLSVFEGLLVLDPTTLRPTPGAAEALPAVSADGKTFTYTLRAGLTYSDGAPLTATDFAYAYGRNCDARTRTDTNAVLFVIVGCERLATMDPESATAADFETAHASLGVKALDDRRIEFTTVEPAPYFPAITLLAQGLPSRRADVERGATWTQPGTYVGNGPFKLVSWDRGQSMVFERNERYRTPVKLKSWKLVMVQDKTVEFNGYQNDEIHFIEVTTEQLRAVEADPTLRAELRRVPTGCSHYYAFNAMRPPFDDPKVRLAFAKAIDRADYVEKILGGIGQPADHGFIPAGHPGYDDGDSAQAFDPAAAKRLLAESTYAGSLPPIKFTTWATSVNQLNAQWVVEQWRTNLGVEVTAETIESRVFNQVVLAPETAPQIHYTGWCSDIPDAHNFHATVWGAGGAIAVRTGFSDPKVDAALKDATEARDPAAVADQYIAAGRLLSSAAPAAWLYYSQRAALVKPWVKGLTPPAHRYTALAKREIYMIKH